MIIDGNHIIAESGFILTNQEHEIFTDDVYLGVMDSSDNWIEITIEEMEIMRDMIES